MRNPYVVGKWVSHDHFYGRERLVDELLHGFENCFWVIGNRRIGKTSLLKQLEHLCQDSASYLGLYWDIEGCHSMGDLGEALVEAVETTREGLGLSLAGQEVTDVLRTLSREAAKSDRRLLLLCDEGEALMNVEEAEPRSLQRLRRAIHTDANIRFVLTSSKRLSLLDELCRDWVTSPFLHGFAVRYLGSLTDTAAENLIRQTQRGALVYASPELIGEIKQVTGNHPYLIQLLCHRLWQEDGSLRQIEDGDLVVDESLARFFDIDFGHLSESERRILHEMYAAGQVTAAQLQATLDLPSLSTFLHGLTQLGYLRQEGEVYAIGNRFLASWLEMAPWEESSKVSDEATLVAYSGQRTFPSMPYCFKVGVAGCPKQVQLDPQQVFVGMPFRDEFEDAYVYGIRSPLEGLGFKVWRADEEPKNIDLMCKICEGLQSSRYAVLNI
ncbi:MAG: hypothetical protein GTO63_37300, partial [Anaerolineae bacterium]|nr:hypothetical protein [Anaerolineae bacterium]NIO00413.1 hypothetical protein [Anaerolineae bacterium]